MGWESHSISGRVGAWGKGWDQEEGFGEGDHGERARGRIFARGKYVFAFGGFGEGGKDGDSGIEEREIEGFEECMAMDVKLAVDVVAYVTG